MRKQASWAATTAATAMAFFGAALAQAPQTAPTAERATTATPPMWRVADADSEFILLGTFHILPPDLDWRTDALKAAFANAETVYFELEADAPDTQSKAVAVMMTQGFNPTGVFLTDMLNAADAQKLREIVADIGLPIAGVDPMRPWNAFLTLSVQFIVKQGFEPGAGLDTVLLSESRALGKELVFFETLEEQLAFFTGLSPEVEMELLEITLRDWDNQTASFRALFEAWRTGDDDAIDTLMNAEMRDLAPEVYERLIVARNQAWAETLESALNDGDGKALVAVGAGHLVGDEYSVPALLAAKGFVVSRYGVAANDNAAPD